VKVSRIAEIEITCRDAAKAAETFNTNFELAVEGQTTVRAGSTTLSFLPLASNPEKPAGLAAITLETEDLAEARERLRQLGCEIVEEEDSSGRPVILVTDEATHGLRLRIRQAAHI